MLISYDHGVNDLGNDFYYITINNRGVNDATVSNLLSITFHEYTNILSINGGYYDINKGYIFKNQEDAETALVTLKMLFNFV